MKFDWFWSHLDAILIDVGDILIKFGRFYDILTKFDRFWPLAPGEERSRRARALTYFSMGPLQANGNWEEVRP